MQSNPELSGTSANIKVGDGDDSPNAKTQDGGGARNPAEDQSPTLFKSWKKEPLINECRRLGLSPQGNKPLLIERLQLHE